MTCCSVPVLSVLLFLVYTEIQQIFDLPENNIVC